jgi:hypothetical protein
MTPHYKPYSARHTEEPLGTMMGTWITEEPQSPNPRDSAMPGRKFLFFQQTFFDVNGATSPTH